MEQESRGTRQPTRARDAMVYLHKPVVRHGSGGFQVVEVRGGGLQRSHALVGQVERLLHGRGQSED